MLASDYTNIDCVFTFNEIKNKVLYRTYITEVYFIIYQYLKF